MSSLFLYIHVSSRQAKWHYFLWVKHQTNRLCDGDDGANLVKERACLV